MQRRIFILGILVWIIIFLSGAASKDHTPAPFDYGKVESQSGSKTAMNVIKPCWFYDSIISGSWTRTPHNSHFYNGYLGCGNTNDQSVLFRFCAEADSFILVTFYTKATNSGICSVYVDGVGVDNFDTYNGTVVYNATQETPVKLTLAGEHTLKYKIWSKNASSSAYYTNLIAFYLRKGSYNP